MTASAEFKAMKMDLGASRSLSGASLYLCLAALITITLAQSSRKGQTARELRSPDSIPPAFSITLAFVGFFF